MKLLKVIKLKNDKHKYEAVFDNGKRTKFGATGYSDYTLTGNDKLKSAYIARHSIDLKSKDVTAPGYLSMFLLWNKPTLKASIDDYKKRFHL
jgi:hypothetical protein